MKAVQAVQNIIKGNLQVGKGGLYCVCSSHEAVLRAALRFARGKPYPLIVESTSNQVDQFGGYTGMRPADFVRYVRALADEVGYPKERLILGGDHLGPNAWRGEPSEEAMRKARELVAAYVRAGYRKLHLDASMPCADDALLPGGGLSDVVVAGRAAMLCQVAEQIWREEGSEGSAPFYIIGTEVPVPGGSQENEESLRPSSVQAARQTFFTTKEVFSKQGLDDAFSRVIALVLQPGVEFSDENIFFFDAPQAATLASLAAEFGCLFEAHSTDYQKEVGLCRMVRGHFAVLKVGPWLTYAYREALFALADMEEEMLRYKQIPGPSSCFKESLSAYLLAHPQHWEKYYRGSKDMLAYKCLYSLSDRIRYYWGEPEMRGFVARLLGNLEGRVLPYSLVSQYFPTASETLAPSQYRAENLMELPITAVLKKYERAIR